MDAARTTEDVRSFRSAWRERWLSVRNRLIADPRFQRWAADFPLTRKTAQNKARAVFDLAAGFVYSQILSACIELHLFDILADGPQTLAALSGRVGLDGEGTARLVKAAAALELAEVLPDGRYALGQLGAALRGNPSLVGMIRHHAMLYADLADPVALLRGETKDLKLKSFWAYANNPDVSKTPPEEVRAYSTLMSDSQALISNDVLDAYQLGRFRKLLDVGGGEGAFLSAAGARYSHLDLVLFDLPQVVLRATDRFAAAGLSKRATVFGGDFFRDPLPTGTDVVSLVRVLHDHDDAFAVAILQKIRAVLPTGGTLLIAEPMSGTPGAERVGDAYFGFYLAAMGSGRPRTNVEIAALLSRAGFASSRLMGTRNPMIVRLIEAIA